MFPKSLRASRSTFFAALITACFALLASAPSFAVDPPAPKVTVINPDSDPIPTKIVSSVPLEATITGSVDANLSSSSPIPTVTVGRTSFIASGQMFVPAGERSAAQFVTTVPSDKRLVITFVSFKAGFEDGDGFGSGHNLSLVVTGGHSFDIGHVEQAGNLVGVMSQHTEIYVDGFADIVVRDYRDKNKIEEIPVSWAISGYLEDL